MMRVPLACDLGQVVPQLAYLRAFEAVVELPLRVSCAWLAGAVVGSWPTGQRVCCSDVLTARRSVMAPCV